MWPGALESERQNRAHPCLLVFVSLLLFAPLGLRALFPAVFTMGNGEARGGAGPGRVIPLLCLAGTQGERSQGLQGQPHVSHYGRYYGERVGLTVTFLCLALCLACRYVHTYSHARVCVSVCVSACTRGGIQPLSPGSWPATNVLLLRMPAGASLPSSSLLHAHRPPSPPPG